jgi:membrane-associated protease RseP (regulator of RpoE activity)
VIMTLKRKTLFSAFGLGLTLALALAVTASSDGPPAPPGSKPMGVVPFEVLASKHMAVRAKINGKGPFRLIFDLGAPITLLSNRASEAAGVVKKGAPRSFLFAMRGEKTVEKLEVGGLSAKNLPVIVLDHPALRMLGGLLGDPLDGIIGFTFFARYKTTIDYQAREMTFEPVDFAIRDLMKELPGRLAGPKVAHRRVLAPGGLFGLSVGEPAEGPSAAGVPVVSVRPDSPASAAGLKAGDVLSALDGRWTVSVADTYAAASGVVAGRPVAAVILRDGQELTLTVTPREGF